MAELDNPYKEGYLRFRPEVPKGQGLLSLLKFITFKPSWQKRHCKLFKSSKHGNDRLEVSGNNKDKSVSLNSVSILPLKNCVKIIQDPQKNQPYVFAIWINTEVHHFSASSKDEMSDWINALGTIAFRDNGSETSSELTIEKYNVLYCSSEDKPSGVGLFSVKLIASNASKHCHLEEQSYTLAVTLTALELREFGKNDSLLYSWPYKYIRKYGHKADKLENLAKFTFEAGRNCTSGEGKFCLEHFYDKQIFNFVLSKLENMKKTLIDKECVSSEDKQVAPGTNMAADPQSSSPPSPINSLDCDSVSLTNTNIAVSSQSPTGILSTEINLPVPKPKPRTIFASKFQTLFKKPKELKQYDNVYESSQEENNARKYVGVTDSIHSVNMYTNKTVTKGSNNYDHLKHFGFIPETAPGYKKIYPSLK